MNTQFENLPENKSVFVVSDFHLGAPDAQKSIERERKIVHWLDSIRPNAAGLILAGDLFDFWFEYKNAIPKVGIRVLGKLAELADANIPIIVFIGNHDLWMRDFLTVQLSAPIYSKPESFKIGNQKIQIGHGDGIGPGDHKFKLIKKVFTHPLNKLLFRWIPADLGLYLGNAWSAHSRKKDDISPEPFLERKEPIYIHCESTEKQDHHDYYLFGHRHLPHELMINDQSSYINLGDWVKHYTYVEINQNETKLKYFEA